MLSWLFAKKDLPIKKKHERITRMQNMLFAPVENAKNFFSPTLQQLQCGDKHNVKKLSSIYEENIAQENDKTLLRRLEKDTPLTSRKLMPLSEKIDEQAGTSAILDLMESILTKDKQYTEWMKKLMDSYIKELEFEARFMPQVERTELIVSVFGYVKSIYEMHINEFQPFIEACANDKQSDESTQILNFADKLIGLCKNDTFYAYLLHAMVEKDSTFKRENFYSHLMVYGEQKYQFQYKFDPISQLTHYVLIIEEIFKKIDKISVSVKSVGRMTAAVREFNKELSKIKSACNI